MPIRGLEEMLSDGQFGFHSMHLLSAFWKSLSPSPTFLKITEKDGLKFDRLFLGTSFLGSLSILLRQFLHIWLLPIVLSLMFFI
jgi:hypothetical protein